MRELTRCGWVTFYADRLGSFSKRFLKGCPFLFYLTLFIPERKVFVHENRH